MEVTDGVAAWLSSLDDAAVARVNAVVELLAAHGPTLGRPLVDRVSGSRHHNLKELRVSAGGRHLRVLFAFDPQSTAILLYGGDKTGQWSRWYVTAIAAADALYDEHLARTRDEGSGS